MNLLLPSSPPATPPLSFPHWMEHMALHHWSSPPCAPGRGAPWCLARDGNPVAMILHRRHYSRRPGRRHVRLALGPGEKMVLVSPDGLATVGGRRHFARRGQAGVCAALFRNESPRFRSSDLVRAAVAAARARWPRERFYTYVDAARVRSSNPGYCFRAAGWNRCGETRRGLLILEMPAA